MDKWINNEIYSSKRKFSSFANAFNRKLNEIFKGHNITMRKGHFCISGFITNPEGKHVYLSIPDVSFAWDGRIMVRTATSTEDFSGGMNNWTTFSGIKELVKKLLRS